MANDRDPEDSFEDEDLPVDMDPAEDDEDQLGDGEHGEDAAEPVGDSASKDPKQEKAEKKRLEKEQKDKEKADKDADKKRKEEEKRQLKEQEKKLKDAAKQEKENKKPRKEEREEKVENSKKSGISAFFSPVRPGVRPKNAVRGRVLLLDGSEVEVEIEKDAKAQILIDKVCEYVNLLERDYFSCMYSEENVEKFWLIHDRKLSKQVGSGPWTFEFCVKFYPPEPSVVQEDITRYQFCLQIRADILAGKLPCSPVASAVLGSFTAQSELGDYDVGEHGSGIEYLQDILFTPHQTDELLFKIAELHRSDRCRGRTPAEAELTFLENAKKLELYGVHLCPAKDGEFFDIAVGVSATGIHIYRDLVKVNRFPWPKVLKMSYKHKTFYVKIRPGEFERFENTIGFKMDSHLTAKRFWRLAIEHHTFFRLKEPLHLNQSFFSRFGSTKSRFSGRTHYQSRVFSTSVSRLQPSFERSFSSRSLASRSFANNSFVDRDEKRRSATLDSRVARRDRDDNLHETFNGSDDRQIAVVAGTAPDASRVAYVKTVRPEIETHAAHDPNDDVTWRRGTIDQYMNLDQPNVENVSHATNGYPADPNFAEDLVRSNGESGAEPKKKKKKRKPSLRASESTTADEYGAPNSLPHTERVGQIELASDRRVIESQEDIDHDLALSKAIYSVTDVNTDMSVERIQINPSDVARSMTGGSEENIDIVTTKPTKKTKKKRDKVAA